MRPLGRAQIRCKIEPNSGDDGLISGSFDRMTRSMPRLGHARGIAMLERGSPMPTVISSPALDYRRSTRSGGRSELHACAAFVLVAVVFAVATLHFESQRIAEGGPDRTATPAESSAALGAILP